jgi:hypothetical protein
VLWNVAHTAEYEVLGSRQSREQAELAVHETIEPAEHAESKGQAGCLTKNTKAVPEV